MLRLIIGLLIIFSIGLSPPLYAATGLTEKPEVKLFIENMVKKYKFNKQNLITLFQQVKIHSQVIKSINKPLEKQPWHTYQMLFVSEWRIQHGLKFWKKYASTLKKAEQTYGVPAEIIVATLGIETKYGQKTGSYRVIDALSNLAFSDLSRAPFFRKELEQYLLLTRENQLDPLKVMGSYAGAIGQPQFMPSSYRTYAVNFSQSGKIDLIHNEIDVIGSIANYYKQRGWMPHGPIAEQAYIVGDRYSYLMRKNKLTMPLAISELNKYGIVTKNKLTQDKKSKVKIIELRDHYNKEYWLGFHNFDVIKRYNSSDAYAMAVFQLSSYIKALRERLHED